MFTPHSPADARCCPRAAEIAHLDPRAWPDRTVVLAATLLRLATCVRSLRGRTDEALTRHFEPIGRFETTH
jgi:hypothetical protein